MVNILNVSNSLSIGSRTMRLMLYTLFSLIVADGLITQFLVTNGKAIEGNLFLQAWVGQEMFLAIKVSGAFLITLFLWMKYNAKPLAVLLSSKSSCGHHHES